jgi:hypothetical protein
VLKNGSLPICTRITINGARAEFVIQKTIDKNLWDFGRGQAKGFSKDAREENDYLLPAQGKNISPGFKKLKK